MSTVTTAKTRGTDFAWLQSADAQEAAHPHGPNVVHGPHPELAHYAYRHGHQYDIHGPGSAGTYSTSMFKALGEGKSEGGGPKHDHLEHLTLEEYNRRERRRIDTEEERIA